MRTRYTAICLSFILLVMPFVSHGITRTELLKQQINTFRVTNHLPALKTSTSLSRVAQQRAASMFAYGYFGHTSAYARTFKQLIDRTTFRTVTSGENLAKDTTSTAQTVKLWSASAGHRENLLSNNFTHVGIAIVSGRWLGRQATITVAVFAKKAR